MSTGDAGPGDAAVRLWEAAAAHPHPTDVAPEISARLLVQLEAGLRRWVGAEGYASLLSRSVAEVLPLHPALATVPDLLDDHTTVAGLAPSTVDGQQAAVIALLTTMMRQLGAIIGDRLAVRLFEQSGTPAPRGSAGPGHHEPTS